MLRSNTDNRLSSSASTFNPIWSVRSISSNRLLYASNTFSFTLLLRSIADNLLSDSSRWYNTVHVERSIDESKLFLRFSSNKKRALERSMSLIHVFSLKNSFTEWLMLICSTPFMILFRNLILWNYLDLARTLDYEVYK